MTDERAGVARILKAIMRLPRDAGVVFRHHSLPNRERRALFDQVRALTRRRQLILMLAGRAKQASAWQADGWHGRVHGSAARHLLHSAPVHSLAEMRAAERAGADILFLSPAFATRSHPGARALGRVRFASLARQARRPVIALGGMTKRRASSLKGIGIHGWAAIDALVETSDRCRRISRDTKSGKQP